MKIINIGIVEIIDGIFCTIYVSITIIVGIFIFSKYFIHKKKDFIYVGISWISLGCCYLGPALNFLLIITINVPLNQYIYLAMLGFAPISVSFFITAIIDFMIVKPKNQKIILISTWLLLVIVLTIFYYFLFTNIILIGVFINPYVIHFSLFTQLYILLSLILIILMGLLFAKSCFRSDNPEIKLKAKLLMIAFISFSAGAILSNFFTEIILIAIGTMILALSSLEFYVGYILPEWIKKLFLEDK